MTNRREFLQTSVSVSVLPLAMNGLLPQQAAAARGDDARMKLHGAVIDDRYAEARRFAAALGGLGVRAEALRNGDVTDAYLALDLLWRERAAAIAGLTQFGPMFVLERLGRERGLRLALRVEHRVRADGMLEHVMSGAPETIALGERLHRDGVEWPVSIAALAASCRGECRAPIERTVAAADRKPAMRMPAASAGAGEPESVIHYYRPFALQHGRAIPWDGPLFSWVIGPAARA